MGSTKTIKQLLSDAVKVNEYVLLLYNDDIHSFEYVIDSLMEICHHNFEQAEQCAVIVHNNGKCDIKRGGFKKLRTYYDALVRCGLTVEITE
jgi:ATP-dependent Clp protease adaptor protein ClpS